MFNLLAGCTDEIQVVDAGFGALIKRCTDEVTQEWFTDDKNWAEWTGPNLSARRKRILTTHWYGGGYERACCQYNFPATFNRTGSNLTADGSGDDMLKLQGLAEFSFTLDDARRDPLTGEMAEEDIVQDARIEADNTAADSENSECEELSHQGGSESDDGGGTTDGDEGPPYEPEDDGMIVAECPESNKLEGLQIAHRFETGAASSWHIGLVRRRVMLSVDHPENNGRYAVKYPDDRKEFFHDLFPEDYGVTKVWVVVRPADEQQ